jgi:hypothetical protein
VTAPSWRGYVSRAPGAHRFGLLDIAQFEGMLTDDGGDTPTGVPIVGDLSLGGWRCHQVANEFADQLGLDLPVAAVQLAKHSGRSEHVGSDLLGLAIDAESKGEGGTTASLEAATALLDWLAGRPAKSFFVILPIHRQPIGQQNIRFIEFLAAGLRDVGGTLTLVATGSDPDNLPSSWQPAPSEAPGASGLRAPRRAAVDRRWAAVPGLIPSGTPAAATDEKVEAITLARGLALIPPSLRPDDVSPDRRHRPLRAIEGAPAWVVAYQQSRGLDTRSDLRAMGDYAWACFQRRDGELGLQLLQDGSRVARFPSPQGDLLVSLLAMQIGCHRYTEAAADERRPRGVTPTMLEQWLRGKAYAAALSGDSQAAAEWLAQSGRPPRDGPPSWYDLYLGNLEALIHFRSGDRARAEALQHEIEESLRSTTRDNWHLRYLNAINLARLDRDMGRHLDAEARYHQAFAITDGTRLEHDLVYMNVCLARIADDLRDEAASSRRWTRAALHFAACTIPEALGWRCASAILQRRVEPDDNITDAVAKRLTERLAPLTGADGSASTWAPTFVYTELATHGRPWPPPRSIVGDDWSVLLHDAAIPAPYDSTAHRTLRAILWSVLRGQAGLPDTARPGLVQVDARFGREVPRTVDEAMDVAVRAGASSLVVSGRQVTLTAPLRAQWERESTATLGPGVTEVTYAEGRTVVSFRRQVSPLTLEGAAAATLDRALTLRTVGALLDDHHAPQTLVQVRALEAQRALVVERPPSALSLDSLLHDASSLGDLRTRE